MGLLPSLFPDRVSPLLTEEVPAQQYLEIDEVTPDSFRVSWHPLSADEGQHKLMWIPVYGGRTEEVSGGGRKVPQGVLAGFPGGSAVKNPPAMREARVDPWVSNIPQRREWQPTPAFFSGKSRGPRSPQSMGSQRVGHDLATK